MTEDLITWLRAQLQEDERAARAWLPLGNPTAADREHIARHDPARTLADVDAKRRILEWAEFWMWDDDRGGPDPMSVDAVRLLALPYADRPGYRPEWAP